MVGVMLGIFGKDIISPLFLLDLFNRVLTGSKTLPQDSEKHCPAESPVASLPRTRQKAPLCRGRGRPIILSEPLKEDRRGITARKDPIGEGFPTVEDEKTPLLEVSLYFICLCLYLIQLFSE
ncbi:hypothetical protein ACFDTO_26670 [Microbacteriaceae bacterium 4G12]